MTDWMFRRAQDAYETALPPEPTESYGEDPEPVDPDLAWDSRHDDPTYDTDHDHPDY